MVDKKQDEIIEPVSKKRLFIIGGVIAVILIIVAIASAVGNRSHERVDSLTGKVETASIEAIQPVLDLYYMENGYYPYDYDTLIEHQKDNTAEDLRHYASNVKDFKYTRRGDEQAYKITYTNIAGEEVIVQGNYKEDYR